MSIVHAEPAEVIDVRPLKAALPEHKTHTLLKTNHVEVIRMIMPAGKTISEHRAPGEITVQCLEGRILFTTLGKTIELEPGQLIYLNEREPHSVEAIEDSSFLLTILLNNKS